MDPVSAGVGLAASLATLIGIGSKSYTALSTLTSQMKSAPERIRELCRKVRRLEELLSAVHTFVNRMRDDELPPNVRKWWDSNMNDITANLKALEKFAERLNVLHKEATSNGSKFNARLKTVLSSDEIAKYETSIESNIKELDMLRGYLDSWKLHEAQTILRTVDMRTQNTSTSIDEIQPALVREIRSNFESFEPIINAKFDSVNQAVETVRNHVLATHIRLRRVQSSGNGVSSNCHAENWRMQASETQRRGRLPRWNIEIFHLPIGTLVVETSKNGHIGTSENAQMHHIAFRFEPKPWMLNGIFSVEHFFSIAANNSPTWQRVQRRVPSMLSEELLNSLEEADLLQLGSILASFCSFESLRLVSDQYLPRRPDYAKSSSLSCASGDDVTDFRFSFKSLSESSSITIGADLLWVNRGPQSKPMLVCKHDLSEAFPIELFRKCFGGEPHERPTMLVPPDDLGYRFFIQHVCPCLESMEFEELDNIDRWWLSALNHEDPRFGAAIQSHLYHLDESGEHLSATLRHVTGKDYLNYDVTVERILSASHAERENFLRMVYVCCTAKCLRPFLDAGHDPNTILGINFYPSISFYQLAVQARNIPIIQELKEKGLPFSVQDSMTPVYASMDEKEIIDFQKEQKLLNAILLLRPNGKESASSLVYYYCHVNHVDGSKYDRNNRLYQSDLREFAGDELYRRGLGFYCHPPYQRRLFLGPELLAATISGYGEQLPVPRLLYMGASLDYAGPSFLPYDDQRTALTWSIDAGRVNMVLQMAIAANNFEDYDASVRAGYQRAKLHLNAKHPRQFLVPMPDSPSFPDPVSRWEERQLENLMMWRNAGNAFQAAEVSQIQDILTYTILELIVAGGSVGRTNLAAMVQETERLDRVFYYDLKHSPEEALRILTRLTELAGVDKPKQAQTTNIEERLTQLMQRVRHYLLSTRQISWSQAAMAAVGLTFCLRAMMEHMLYEFVAWVWIQRVEFNRLWPFVMLSTVFLFAAWVM